MLAITIVGVAGKARGNHGNVLANTEQRHGNMQHLRAGARFVTVKRNTGSYDDNKQGEFSQTIIVIVYDLFERNNRYMHVEH